MSAKVSSWRPKCGILENVVGLLRPSCSSQLQELLSMLRSNGYYVCVLITNPTKLGYRVCRPRVSGTQILICGLCADFAICFRQERLCLFPTIVKIILLMKRGGHVHGAGVLCFSRMRVCVMDFKQIQQVMRTTFMISR